MRRRQAPRLRGRHVLREGRRGGGHDADDGDRLGQRRDPDADPDAAPRHARRGTTATATTHAPGRGDPVSRTYRILIVAVVALARRRRLLEAGARAQAREAAELEQQVAAPGGPARPDAGADRDLRGRARRTTRPTTPRSCASARPSRPTTTRARCVVQLDAAAKRSGVDFDTHQQSTAAAARRAARPARADRSRAPSTPARSRRCRSASPSAATFATLGNFFSRLEHFVSLKGDKIAVSGRLLRVESIELAAGRGRLAGADGPGRRQLLHRARGRAAATAGATGAAPPPPRPRPPRRRPPRPTPGASIR